MPIVPRARGVAWLLFAAALPPSARAAAAGDLPTGDDGAFRAQMMDWSPPAAADDHADDPSSAVLAAPLGLPLRALPRISSGFGMRVDPLGLGRRLHPGIDLPGVAGLPVLASGAGVVDRAGWAGGYGNMVEIDHGGGTRTRYGHLERILVAAGEAVAAGEVVGLMGSTGHSTGPHLHYEIRLDGRAVNPLAARYVGGVERTEYPPYIPPATEVAPRWKGWATSTNGLLPSASEP